MEYKGTARTEDPKNFVFKQPILEEDIKKAHISDFDSFDYQE